MELSKEAQHEMYWKMLLSRKLDERAWRMIHTGEIAFHVSAIGHEAAQVGAAFALRPGVDWVAPYYRDLALMIALGYTPHNVMLNLMGKAGDLASGGRQMPGQWSWRQANVISSTPLAASHIPHAVGIALGIKLRKEARVVLAICGEGATSSGDWYEAVNWASVQKLPVVFFVENNQYAISTRIEHQMAVRNVADKSRGLGLPGYIVDGMDVFAVHREASRAIEAARRGGGPSLIEAKVYRLTPHSSDDDDRLYRSREEVLEYKAQDPLEVARQRMENANILSRGELKHMGARADELVNQAVEFAQKAVYPSPESGSERLFAGKANHA